MRPLLVLLGRPVLLLLVLLGWLKARTSVAAGSNGNNLPLLVLHLQVLALRVERAVNQMVEVVEAKVEQRVLEVVLKTLHEVLLLFAVIRNLGRGVASKLQKAITILRDRHSPLNSQTDRYRKINSRFIRIEQGALAQKKPLNDYI